MSQSAATPHILQTIEESAARQAAAIVAEAEDLANDALARATERVTEETEQLKLARFSDIRTETGRRICAAENEARAGLFRRREAIRQEVFQKAKVRIVAFTHSDDYLPFLLRSAERIHVALGGKCEVLNMREADRSFAAEVSARLGRSITLHIDPTIQLGGITVISADGTMMADDTLDSRLQQQETWFMEQSGLVIE